MIYLPSKKSAVDVVAALHNFYEAFFPIRSQFELPTGFRNRFLHISELREWRAEQAKLLSVARVCLVLLVIAVVCYIFWAKIKQLKRFIFGVSPCCTSLLFALFSSHSSFCFCLGATILFPDTCSPFLSLPKFLILQGSSSPAVCACLNSNPYYRCLSFFPR